MNPAAAATTVLQPLVSVPTRIAAGVAALAIVVAVVGVARPVSARAVETAHAQMNPAIVYVKLPTVEVHARHTPGEPVTELACVNPHSRT